MKNALLWIFKLIVTVLTLAYILTIIPITPITQTLGKLEFVSVIWSVPIILLSSVVAALQLKVFTDNHHMHLSFPRILSINFSTEFYNLFLPGFIAGGAIRCHKLSQYNKKQAEAFAALVLNRLMNTLTLAFFGFICWQFDTTTITNDWYGRFFLALFIGLLGLYALLFSKRIATAFHDLSLYPWYQLIPSILGRGLSKLHEAAMEFQQLSRREHSAIIFLSFSWQILGIAFFYLIARAIDLDMSFESLGWIRAGLGLLLLLPISISGIGVREGGLIFLLAYFGIAPAVAIAFSFLLFARTIFLGLVGAVLEAKEILIPIESQD